MTRKADTTFMEYVRAVWASRFPDCDPPLYAPKALRGVYRALGDEEATNRLRKYLATQEAKYVNLWNFASTHSDYADEHPKGASRDGGLVKLKEALPEVKEPPTPTLANRTNKKHTEETPTIVVDPTTGRLTIKP